MYLNRMTLQLTGNKSPVQFFGYEWTSIEGSIFWKEKKKQKNKKL